ncbi:MAG: tRNA dimethylallyltransferase [Bacteroidetes bacterium]|nr:tRNA dimethylallyltransferase [Bacteroidota bacterium]
MKEKQCIIVAGPTAIGKTAEAIRLAKLYNTSIISADSRQCYHELKIGVARPTDEELKEVKHYFIANHSITENISAATFAKEASAYLDEIFKDHNIAIVCGGTGLYIKALVEGLDDIPPIPDEIRAEVTQLYKEKGIDVLRNRLLELDPLFAERGDVHNPQRMMRALEVVVFTERSIFEFHQKREEGGGRRDERRGTRDKGEYKDNNDNNDNNYNNYNDYNNYNNSTITFTYRIIELHREELYNRINKRVDKMIEEGLEDEVRSLIAYRDLPALQTVGYKEFFDYFDGKCTREEAIDKIKQHTRNYAKRQVTWFKRITVGG